MATYDGIDVLYNNASAQRFGALDELSVEDWDFTMRNELTSSTTRCAPRGRT